MYTLRLYTCYHISNRLRLNSVTNKITVHKILLFVVTTYNEMTYIATEQSLKPLKFDKSSNLKV